MYRGFGQTDFIWFEGVVEDRIDPKMLFRVRVRMYGIYTEDKALIPTEHLHWAQVMHPTTSPAMSEIGHTPFFVEGTHVIGFFRDGLSCQDPIVIGTIAGIPKEPANPALGFYDPFGKYPLYLEEADTSRHARHENIGLTLTEVKRQQRLIHTDKPVPAHPPLNQEEIPYATVYPYNKVHQTESGHVIEYDDTEGHERICISHRTGSFIEIHPDGKVTVKSMDNMYELVTGEKQSITLKDENLHIGGNWNVHVEGDWNVDVMGDINFNVGGKINATSGDDQNFTTGGTYKVEAAEDIILNAGGAIILNGASLEIGVTDGASILASGGVSIGASSVDIGSSGGINLSGSDVVLKGGGILFDSPDIDATSNIND
jgi:hypothetical protein